MRFPTLMRICGTPCGKKIDSGITPIDKGLISGSDIDSEAIRLARKNLERLPYGNLVTMVTADFRDIQEWKDGVIVTNPPYGKRISPWQTIPEFYKEFGDFLKQRCTNTSAFIYVGEPALLKTVGLRTTWKKELVNGALEGRLAKYELYGGSKTSPRKAAAPASRLLILATYGG